MEAQLPPVPVSVVRVEVQDARELADVPGPESLGIVDVERVAGSSRAGNCQLGIEGRSRQGRTRRGRLAVLLL